MKLKKIQFLAGVNMPRKFIKKIGVGERYTNAFIGWKKYYVRNVKDKYIDFRIGINCILFFIKFIFVKDCNKKCEKREEKKYISQKIIRHKEKMRFNI